MTKAEVREVAEKHNFVTAHKQDTRIFASFLMVTTLAFIEKRTGKKFKPGNFIDTNGNILGRHKGIIHYTVGQRKGLGLALPAPMYVQAY